jgi:hypothetical protein
VVQRDKGVANLCRLRCDTPQQRLAAHIHRQFISAAHARRRACRKDQDRDYLT